MVAGRLTLTHDAHATQSCFVATCADIGCVHKQDKIVGEDKICTRST